MRRRKSLQCPNNIAARKECLEGKNQDLKQAKEKRKTLHNDSNSDIINDNNWRIRSGRGTEGRDQT